jgi:uncharacterized membrane protein
VTPTPRWQLVDVARGVAFVAMVVYHACWFADARGLLDLPIGEHLGWRLFQMSIAGTFYYLVGASLVLANRDRVRIAPFLQRLGKLCAAALVVTLASLVLDRHLLVTYGILHNIAVCSVVGLLLLRAGRANLLLGAVAVLLGALVESPLFDAPWLRWLGLGTTRTPAFDFQPFLPWFGVVLWGMVAGREALRPGNPLGTWWSNRPAARLLELMGRHSLLLYMAHVPVLVVSVEILAWLRGI